MTEVFPEPASREEQLKQIYLQIAGDAPLSDQAQAYVDDGNSLRNALAELSHLREPSELDEAIAASRAAYMKTVLKRPTIINRLARKKTLVGAEAVYKDAVTNKLAAYVTAGDSAQAALDLGQLPGIIRKSAFGEQPTLLRDLAANQLHLAMDALLQEHAARRQIIARHNDRTPLTRLRNSRELQAGVAIGVFAAAFMPEVLAIPAAEEGLVADITLGLKIASALVFSVDTPEVIRLWYLDYIHNKRTHELNEQLSHDQEATDLALRIAYGSPHYGSSTGFMAHSARSGTNDPKLNAAALDGVDRQIDNMHGDPGGRPYTGQQALGYAARFLLERHDQLATITNESDPKKRQELYLQLVREVIQEDLDRMKKGLTITRFRKTIMRSLAMAVAPLLPNSVNEVSDAFSNAQDISSLVSGPKKNSDELEP